MDRTPSDVMMEREIANLFANSPHHDILKTIEGRAHDREASVRRWLMEMRGLGENGMMRMSMQAFMVATYYRSRRHPKGIRAELVRMIIEAGIKAENALGKSPADEHIGYEFLWDYAVLKPDWAYGMKLCREASIEGIDGDWQDRFKLARQRHKTRRRRMANRKH